MLKQISISFNINMGKFMRSEIGEFDGVHADNVGGVVTAADTDTRVSWWGGA